MRRISRPAAGRRPRAAPMTGIGTGPTTDWVKVPRSVRFRNRGSFWVGGKLLRRQPHLAICQDRVAKSVVLLFCDPRWNVRALTTAASVDEAKQQAERYYPGLSPYWVSAGVSERQAKQYMERLRRETGCSFCGRAPAEHGGSQAEARNVRICSSCVEDLHADFNKTEQS
jgi:hypothetical protein